MNSDNLIFSSKIDAEVEESCFEMLLNYYKNNDNVKVYVENIALAPNEIMFFANVDDVSTIIRIPITIV